MCCNNRKNTCVGNIVSSICTKYMGYLPEYSTLNNECASIEETTEELYENQEKILDSIDLVKLGKECIDYSEFQETNILKVNEALLTIEKEICNLKKNIDDDNSSLELDFKCLVDPCNNNITSLNQLLQIMIDKICKLEQRIITLEKR